MKRILLLGDSIRIGYCEKVASILDGKAEVCWPGENCRFAQYMIAAMGGWASAVGRPETIDVVHWNCGQWDTAQFERDGRPLVTEDEYEKALVRVDALIRRLFPNAQVIFALTTPVLPGVPMTAPRTTDDVVRYNRVAQRVMDRLNVPVNDLFSVAAEFSAGMYKDAVHFTPEGYQVLAEAVVRALEKYTV
ncbi:MAG: SGNH/GDSL hydrolase family protein [Clostridia bacterium]|nr:SGNH/GDSL hydrolase family protein [Clostridia bacterium]